jgi:hypothetical protein
MTHTMPQTYCLQEINGLIHLLLDDLLELLQEPIDTEDQQWVSAVVDYIALSLRQKFDMETCEGYLAEVTEFRPNWTPQVLRLRAEFVQLLKQIALLRRQIPNSRTADDYTRVCRSLKDWTLSFRRHQSHGNRLFQEAYLLDVGVGD